MTLATHTATPEPAVVAKPRTRDASLDHIRIFLTASVVMHHTVITYGGPGGWFCHEKTMADMSPLVQLLYILFAATQQAYFMGFFFLLAGYFTPQSFVRKGAAAYLRDRFVRLGLPLLAFIAVLAPLTTAMGQAMMGAHPFWGTYKWLYVNRVIEVGPLWFAEALLVFAVLFALWSWLRPVPAGVAERPLPAHWKLFAAALGTGLLAFAIRLYVPVGKNIFGMQLGYFASYVVLFVVGCAAARHRWLQRVTLRYALPWMIVTAACMALLVVTIALKLDMGTSDGGWTRGAIYYALWEPFTAWGLILGMLWFFPRYLARPNSLTLALGRAAFAAYIAHAPVLVGISWLARPWAGPAPLKAVCVGALAIAGSFCVGWLATKVPGVRRVV